MLSSFRNQTGAGIGELIRNGAVVVDVRTPDEFGGGHAKGSKNIPLDEIEKEAATLKTYPHVIVCCRSGTRSAYAARLLKSAGVENVTNAGSWQNVSEALAAQ